MPENAPFKLRLPPELREKLDQAADANNRSVTAEMVHRLENSFLSTDATSGPIISTLLGEIARMNSARAELSRQVELFESFQAKGAVEFVRPHWAPATQSLAATINAAKTMIESIEGDLADHRETLFALTRGKSRHYSQGVVERYAHNLYPDDVFEVEAPQSQGKSTASKSPKAPRKAGAKKPTKKR